MPQLPLEFLLEVRFTQPYVILWIGTCNPVASLLLVELNTLDLNRTIGV
jgi:hypothetical protein